MTTTIILNQTGDVLHNSSSLILKKTTIPKQDTACCKNHRIIADNIIIHSVHKSRGISENIASVHIIFMVLKVTYK